MAGTATFGDLVVKQTLTFQPRWNDQGSGADRDGAFWHPVPQDIFRPLGSVVVAGYGDINGQRASLLVSYNASKVGPKGPAVKEPTDYQLMWADNGSGAKQDGSIWRPVAPAGYVAVGDVAASGYNKPDLTQVWCLRADLALAGGFWAGSVWDDRGSGADMDGSFWEVLASVPARTADAIPALAGTFVSNQGYGQPAATIARVPGLSLLS
ncbi:hypothetical protein QBC44DRAFT_9110 [Cladorrhinum sp. PSN332]|nr:hypothetical protein QBC44DRAFT_9110 [Cladorrhinum sp. PSN332]